MTAYGLDPNFLDLDANAPVPAQEMSNARPSSRPRRVRSRSNSPLRRPPRPAILAVKDMPEFQMYKKFWKLVQLGMPVEGLKIRMKAEGLNPDVLHWDQNAPPPKDGETIIPSD